MQSILLSREEVGRRAKELYENSIRQQVEREENIGKMVIIDQYGSVKAEKLISDMKFRSFNSLSSTSVFWLF
ncbi:MAG: hypothetical protein V7K45_23955, partial [Nostoc sp.]